MSELPVTGIEEQGGLLLGETLDPYQLTAGPFLPPPKYEQTDAEFFWMMAKVGRANSVLEIGSREGGGLREMSAFLAPGARICSIDADVPHPEWQNCKQTGMALRDTIDELRGKGFDAQVFIGNCHEAPALAWAKERGPFDFIFIDADHRYIAVRNDWERYGPLGKLVGFHDIVFPTIGKLWADIKASGKTTEEMIAPGGTGVGLVTVG